MFKEIVQFNSEDLFVKEYIHALINVPNNNGHGNIRQYKSNSDITYEVRSTGNSIIIKQNSPRSTDSLYEPSDNICISYTNNARFWFQRIVYHTNNTQRSQQILFSKMSNDIKELEGKIIKSYAEVVLIDSEQINTFSTDEFIMLYNLDGATLERTKEELTSIFEDFQYFNRLVQNELYIKNIKISNTSQARAFPC